LKHHLTEITLGAAGRFAAFDDLVTLTVQAADGDARHGLFLPQGGYEDEAQCDINLSPSPLLKHYRIELMHMLKKRQMVVEAGDESRPAAELFYALAA